MSEEPSKIVFSTSSHNIKYTERRDIAVIRDQPVIRDTISDLFIDSRTRPIMSGSLPVVRNSSMICPFLSGFLDHLSRKVSDMFSSV